MRASLDVFVDIVVSAVAWVVMTKFVLSVRRRRHARLRTWGIAPGMERPAGWLSTYARVGSGVVLVQAVGAVILYVGFVVLLAVLQIMIDGPSWAETLGIALLGVAITGSFLAVAIREVVGRIRAARALH